MKVKIQILDTGTGAYIYVAKYPLWEFALCRPVAGVRLADLVEQCVARAIEADLDAWRVA